MTCPLGGGQGGEIRVDLKKENWKLTGKVLSRIQQMCNRREDELKEIGRLSSKEDGHVDDDHALTSSPVDWMVWCQSADVGHLCSTNRDHQRSTEHLQHQTAHV